MTKKTLRPKRPWPKCRKFNKRQYKKWVKPIRADYIKFCEDMNIEPTDLFNWKKGVKDQYNNLEK